VRDYYDTNVAINAQNNWWGTVDESVMESDIMDGSDTTLSGYPMVSYDNYLSSGPGLPTIAVQLNQTVTSGNVELLDASDSHSIHGIVSYDWEQISGPVVTLQNSGDSVASYTAPDSGLKDIQLEFQLTVQDSLGRVSHENFIVTVKRNAFIPIMISDGLMIFI